MNPYAVRVAEGEVMFEYWVVAGNPDEARSIACPSARQVEVLDLSDAAQARSCLVPHEVVIKAGTQRESPGFLLDSACVRRAFAHQPQKPPKPKGRPKGSTNKPKDISHTAVLVRSVRQRRPTGSISERRPLASFSPP